MLAGYDVLLCLRVFAIDVLGDCLVERDGHNHLLVVRAQLSLLRPFHLAHVRTVELLDLVVVQGHRELLVLVVHVVVVVLELGALLHLDDTLHELDSRIVLADIASSLRLNNDFTKLFCVGFELDGQTARSGLGDVHTLVLVTHTGEGERGAINARNGKDAV